MTITIEEEEKPLFDFDYHKLTEEVIKFSLEYEKFPYEAEVNVILTDAASIREINLEYRDMDKSTDVLSFPMLNLDAAGDYTSIKDYLEDNFNPDTGEVMLGDIVISVPKVMEQAELYGHTPKREYAFLIVHSVLHLLGYDHMTPKDAAFMENKQETILKEMEIFR
ncbi:MAG: rRNA maturation RNase YbeY [Eubacterium sp.]|jgi:probable rRNA maturation factor|nr:rRNA maturation RNase YbeY [Eubacterium sp.]